MYPCSCCEPSVICRRVTSREAASDEDDARGTAETSLKVKTRRPYANISSAGAQENGTWLTRKLCGIIRSVLEGGERI
jgi:hypothetical protein